MADQGKGKKLKPPKILKVKDLEDKTKYPPIHPHLPQPPFLLVGVGSVRSGKTNALIGMLRDNEQFYGNKYWDRVKVISNTINNDPKGKFLKDAFDVEDHYDDGMIHQLVDSQKKFKREEMPTALLVLDDIISRDFKKTNEISFLASRFRHYELSIMIFTQSFRSISPIIRANATNVMIFKQQSSKELEKIVEEYEDLAGEQFINYYNIVMTEPYQFLYIDAQQNPAHFYRNFEELIGIGDKLVYKGAIPEIESEEEIFEEENK
tara:strand:+ start:140 stop:931 length:792 start_codon:yes stop_codon:yes gene_type:complete